MPHYKNGMPVQTGDLVLKSEKHEESLEVAGVLVHIQKSESCNGQLMPLAVRQKGTTSWTPIGMSGGLWYVTLADCTKVELATENMPVPIDTLQHVDAALKNG